MINHVYKVVKVYDQGLSQSGTSVAGICCILGYLYGQLKKKTELR